MANSCARLSKSECDMIPLCEYVDKECVTSKQGLDMLKMSEDELEIKSLILQIFRLAKTNKNIDELAEAITYLDIRGYTRESIKKIVTNKILQQSFLLYINQLKKSEKKQKLDMYQAISSKTFLNDLLQESTIHTFDNGEELRNKIKEEMIISKQLEFADKIYMAIYDWVKKCLDNKARNTSVVYLTSQNSNKSEVIQELGISTYKSIVENFNDFYIINKTSASDSIIFNADLNKPLLESLNVVLSSYTMSSVKLYFKVYPKMIESTAIENSGLDFEKKAYEELFKLVKYNITPNILCTVAISQNITDFDSNFIKNKNLLKSFKDSVLEKVRELNVKIKLEADSIWTSTNIIVTQAGGTSFSQSFGNLGEENQKKILFQLIYTLYVFDKIEFSHGDLHHTNMFIIEVPETELVYVIEGIQFRFKTDRLLKIYDFDNSSLCKSTNIKVNSLNFITINKTENKLRDDMNWKSKELGLSNRFNSQCDIVKTFNLFSVAVLSKPLMLMLKRIMFPEIKNKEKIKDTYEKHLTFIEGGDSNLYNTKTEFEEVVKKVNSVFGIDLEVKRGILNRDKYYVNYKDYNVDSDFLDMTWEEYFKKIKRGPQRVGYIIKSIHDPDNNESNTLWIPDSVIQSKENILKSNLFEDFHCRTAIDIRRDIVYTLDSRVL